MSRPDSIRSEAAIWLARLRADDRTFEDERAFRIWLAADPEHVTAFDAVNTLWEVSGGLPRDLRGQSRHPETAIGRRAALLSFGALVVTAGSFGAWQSAQASVYQTDVGEQKHVSLKDGTEVFLDTETKLVVKFSNARRLVDLQYGRANFRVAPDIKRPFAVQVADHTVIVNHSIFDVRRDGNRVSVILIQGHATVRSEVAQGSSTSGTMSDGERLVQVSNGAARVDKPNLLPLLAWQTGQAIFENEDLAQAAYELNRYSNVKIVIPDPAIARLKVSGVYRVGDNATFARAVANLLPLSVYQQDDQINLIGDPSRMPSE